jgi:hypothetical protein
MRTTHVLHRPLLARSHRGRPPRWHSRLLARLCAPLLDRNLAEGAAAWRSPLYAARAVQLTSPRCRQKVARWLESLNERAERPSAPFRSAAVTPCREQVEDALPIVLSIASQLRSQSPVDAHGIASLRQILSDGGGPCYTRNHPGALARALEDASQWLDVSD